MKDTILTIIVFTHNEERNIKSCLTSARLLSENIIVIDSESSDKTIEIVKKEKISYFSFPYSSYVEPAREFGINKAKTDWVFILDADERITTDLVEEIKNKLKGKIDFSHFKVPRKNIFNLLPDKPLDVSQIKGKWLKYGGWWPDYQIRLINKKYFKKWPPQIHSTPLIEGKFDLLDNPLLHLFHGDFEQMVNKTIVFENIEAELLYQANKKTGLLTFFRKFFGEIFRRLIKHLGFLDGEIGIIEAIYQAFSKTITYLYLYEKKIKSRSL
ncbi:MAG: glycosyltransferase family 2 protein [Microgenomates group bacterium]|nr:glycosyltransferase family 2 protein [Microgenomates group bacterium]